MEDFRFRDQWKLVSSYCTQWWVGGVWPTILLDYRVSMQNSRSITNSPTLCENLYCHCMYGTWIVTTCSHSAYFATLHIRNYLRNVTDLWTHAIATTVSPSVGRSTYTYINYTLYYLADWRVYNPNQEIFYPTPESGHHKLWHFDRTLLVTIIAESLVTPIRTLTTNLDLYGHFTGRPLTGVYLDWGQSNLPNLLVLDTSLPTLSGSHTSLYLPIPPYTSLYPIVLTYLATS